MAMIRVRVNTKPDPNPNRDSRLGLGSGLVLVPQWQRRKFLPAGAQPRHCNSNGAHLTVTETVIGHAKQANNFAKFGFPSWGGIEYRLVYKCRNFLSNQLCNGITNVSSL